MANECTDPSPVSGPRGGFDEHKFMVVLVGVFLTVNVGWLAWLSMQTISQDRSILVNSTHINTISENFIRTQKLLEEIQEKQHQMELREARNGR